MIQRFNNGTDNGHCVLPMTKVSKAGGGYPEKRAADENGHAHASNSQDGKTVHRGAQ